MTAETGPPSTARRVSRYLTWLPEFAAPGARRLLAWQALADSVGNGLGMGVLTLYLVGPAGLSDGQVAVGFGLMGVASFGATVPAGMLAQRLGARRFAISSNVARAVLFAALAATGEPAAVFVLLALLGVAEAGSYSIYQAVIADAAPEAERLSILAARRSIGNAGFLISAPLVALVLTVDTRAAFAGALGVDAVTFLASALLVTALPRPATGGTTAGAEGPRLAAVRDLRYLTLAGLAALFMTSMVILDVGLPLWVAEHTEAPTAAVAAVLAVNTAMVLVLQQRVAARAKSLHQATRLVRFSGACFFGGCALFFAASEAPAVAAIVVLLAGAALLTVGEMTESAAWWTMSFELAPEERRAEYLATFDLGLPLVRTVGPLAMVAVVGAGGVGWVLFGAAFLAGGLVAGRVVKSYEPRRLAGVAGST